MTLLEVLASLVILSTLLSGLLVAKSRASRQQAMAKRHLEAIGAADELLEKWRAGRPPDETAGQAPGHPNLSWQRSVLDSPPSDRSPFAVARLEIIDPRDRQVLSRVDWLVLRPGLASARATSSPSNGGGQ